MGFRDLHLFNLALLGKHVWRFMKNPNSLCARVMKGRYSPASLATVRNVSLWLDCGGSGRFMPDPVVSWGAMVWLWFHRDGRGGPVPDAFVQPFCGPHCAPLRCHGATPRIVVVQRPDSLSSSADVHPPVAGLPAGSIDGHL